MNTHIYHSRLISEVVAETSQIYRYTHILTKWLVFLIDDEKMLCDSMMLIESQGRALYRSYFKGVTANIELQAWRAADRTYNTLVQYSRAQPSNNQYNTALWVNVLSPSEH
jgi:hypothetical protein